MVVVIEGMVEYHICGMDMCGKDCLKGLILLSYWLKWWLKKIDYGKALKRHIILGTSHFGQQLKNPAEKLLQIIQLWWKFWF